MMKRLRILSVVASILMLSTIFFLSVDAVTPTNIDPGDTFIYDVSTWDVPWEELIPPEEAPFDLADFVFDLSGSTVGVKVMDTYENGYYMLDFYVVLGKTIEIPLPDDADPAIIDIFGTEFTLTEGVGIGLGSLPGSDMTEMLASNEDVGALPFYLNPADWNTYQTELEALDSADAPVTVTNAAGSDFEFSMSGTTPDGVAISISVSWFREGDNAGVFKSISGTVDGDLTGDGVSNHLGIALTFDKKEENVLPLTISTLGDMVLSFTTAEFTHSVTGFSTATSDQIDDTLVYIGDIVTDLANMPVIKFDIQEVTGMYYNTIIEVYNPETEMMEQAGGDLWWNGFTGTPVVNQEDMIFSDLPYTPWGGSVALVPTLAPGITPDWDMWAASTTSLSQVNEIVEKAVEAFFKEENVTSLGLDLNTLDSVYELRESETTMFFYSESKLDLDWNAGQIEGAEAIGLKTTSKLSVEVTSNNWFAYTKEGLLAGAGVEIVALVSATDIPADAGAYETGSISLDANIVLQSDQISSIPDPEDADPIAGGNAGGGGLIPGFEYISPLLVMTTIVVLIKRKKRK
ncbi:hypothetical protein CEE45_09365 [Candidatus Heimdallarchaeota archaeon B3_Heim]|nr:MAG: hypothetical protein CEE45_09365 [Candidatus Heimdallarchaeota archaeon B3_Heim]